MELDWSRHGSMRPVGFEFSTLRFSAKVNAILIQQHERVVNVVEGLCTAGDLFVPLRAGSIGPGVAGQDEFGLEMLQIVQGFEKAPYVQAVLVDMIGE